MSGTKTNNLMFQTAFTVQPQDTNHMDTLFGGKLMQEMDSCAGMTARRALYDSDCDVAVTVHVDGLDFSVPGFNGDLIVLTGEIREFGDTSIYIDVSAEKEAIDGGGERKLMCEADFVFVALKDGKKHPHGLTL